MLNYFIFCGGDLMAALRPAKNRANPNVIHYRHEVKKAKAEADKKPYRFKCAVCGKTDTEYPDLEFRYCSRCAGYHCFCEEHINNHVHFEE